MALTSEQKASIRLYLGYPSLWRYKHTRLESIFDNDLDASAEALVVSALESLAAIETQILSNTVQYAGIAQVDEIRFFKGSAQNDITRLGNMYVNRISIVLGVPIYSNVFGTGGYLGDSYSAGGLGQPINGGRGGMFPLG